MPVHDVSHDVSTGHAGREDGSDVALGNGRAEWGQVAQRSVVRIHAAVGGRAARERIRRRRNGSARWRSAEFVHTCILVNQTANPTGLNSTWRGPRLIRKAQMTTTIYVWPRQVSNVGHASIQMAQTYASYWPGSAAGKADFKKGASHPASFP